MGAILTNMNLKLEQYFLFDAVKEMDCDASKMFFENSHPRGMFNANEAVAIFKARHMKIYSNDTVVYIEVVDTDSGEYLSLNARKSMHELCLKYKLYPKIILNALVK